MAMNPAHRFDQVRRQKRQNEQIRQLRVRPHGHAEMKTYSAEGPITTSRNIPAVFVGVDPDGTIPEVKLLTELRSMLEAGTADVEWNLNGVAITGSSQAVTTDPTASIVTFDPPIRLNHGDYIKPVVVSATGASDLSVSICIVTRQA